jgi:hypothetical protein
MSICRRRIVYRVWFELRPIHVTVPSVVLLQSVTNEDKNVINQSLLSSVTAVNFIELIDTY